jgi:radical SAM-linked protein
MLVAIKFRIRGDLRFLSHAETLRLFQRSCLRAGFRLRYTQGFNPRPILSLPLPRSVGIETEDDLLCLRLEPRRHTDDTGSDSFVPEQFKTRLSEQLPPGCRILDVSLAGPNASFRPLMATYVLTLRGEHPDSGSIKRLLAAETLNLQRRLDAKGTTRNVDVRPFLKSIELRDDTIVVECKISPEGSIRPDEILELLQLNMEKLAVPIRRTNVQWQRN